MNYTFNKKLVEQVKARTHCIEFNREKDSLEMLQALCKYVWPDGGTPIGNYKYYKDNNFNVWSATDTNIKDKTPIPLSDFVQPEQSERDVMAELDEKIAKLEKMGAFEMLDFICSPTMSQRLAKLLNGEFKETPNDPAQLVGEPEPKWTPKVGEWFKDMLESLYYCTVSDQNGVEGDNQNGGKISCTLECELTKPTDKEVEDYMVGLAKEKGFFEGVKFKWGSVNDIRTVGEWIAYDKVNDCLHCKDYVIWNGGIWGEIVNPVRWRAEKGEKYWLVLTNMQAFMENELFLPSDNDHYNLGNYFQTKEQAEEMAVLMQFTLNNPDKVKKLMNDGE